MAIVHASQCNPCPAVQQPPHNTNACTIITGAAAAFAGYSYDPIAGGWHDWSKNLNRAECSSAIHRIAVDNFC